MAAFRSILCTIPVLTLTLFTSAPSSRAADAVLLKPRIDTPAETYVEFTTDMVQKFNGPDGKPMQVTSQSIYGLLQKSTEKGESVEIEATLDRLLGMMAFSETMKSAYDTDEPDFEDASPMHRDAFTPILNMPIKVAVDNKGVATKLDGGDAIRKKLLGLGDQNYIAKGLAEGDLTDRQIMSSVGELPFVLLPYREVKVGESWKKTQNDEYQQVGKVIVNYDCKLDRVVKQGGRDVAVVSYRGTVTKDAAEKPEKGKRLGKIDGTFTGTATFDVAEGRFIEVKRDTQAKIEVPPWWTQDEKAPLMKVDGQVKLAYTVASTADRRKQKDEIARRVADAKAKREAEEAAAMAGPVDPPTPENTPVPWLQWGGPNRDFHSSATGLANRWPKDGPPKLWERPLGDSFSAILADGDALYTTYSVRDKADPLKGSEIIVALEAKTGKTLWEHKYDVPWTKDLQMEFGPGPHSTPLIVGDRIFSIGCTAKLHCLDKKTGKVIWSKDLHEEFKADLLMRGYGSSPLAYQDNILLPVSKEKGGGIMAFKQSDGTLAWKGGDCEPGYASLQVIETDGIEQLIAFTGKAVMGLDPARASPLWSVDHPTQWSANISTPVWGPEDKHLFISSAYGMGSRGIKLEKAGSRITAKEVWFNPKMKIQHGDAVREGEWIYGSSGDFGPTFLGCVNAKTGKFGWRQRGISRANVLYADGKLIVLDEDGTLYLVKADPVKYRLLGKTTGLLKKTAWTVPTLVGRTLYLRDREKIVALDLGAKK